MSNCNAVTPHPGTSGTPETMAPDPEWFRRARCAGMPLAVFFPEATDESTRSASQAIWVCQRCPVQDDCLREALLRPYHEDYGIYGGTTRAQRRVLRHRSIAPVAGVPGACVMGAHAAGTT